MERVLNQKINNLYNIAALGDGKKRAAPEQPVIKLYYPKRYFSPLGKLMISG